MRFAAALTLALSVASAPARAQGIPVGSDQAVDVSTLLELLGPVIQSLGGSATASLDGLSLHSTVGAGDVTQFSRLFESTGFDGEMTTLLSSLQGLGGFDLSSVAQLAAGAGGTSPTASISGGVPGLSHLSGTPAADILSGLSGSAEPSGQSAWPDFSGLAGSVTPSHDAPSPRAGAHAPATASRIRRSTATIDGRTLRKYSNLPTRDQE